MFNLTDCNVKIFVQEVKAEQSPINLATAREMDINYTEAEVEIAYASSADKDKKRYFVCKMSYEEIRNLRENNLDVKFTHLEDRSKYGAWYKRCKQIESVPYVAPSER